MAIIFIPGIKATALANVNTFDFNLIYENYDTFWQSLGSTIRGVRIKDQLQEDPQYDTSEESIIERNHIMTFPYKNSIEDIESASGEKVYLFGYDWRKSNVENAMKLAEFVNHLKGKLKPTETYSFLTHSMGAMVLCCYLKTLPEPEKVINKIVFTAPPFRGGVEALKHLALGSGGLFPCDELSRKAIRTYPALYELSPWYTGAVKDNNNNPLDLSQKAHWQNSIWDDDYMQTIFPARIQAMIDFRNTQFMDLNNLSAEMKARTIIVAGTGAKTLHSVNLISNTANKMYFNFDESIYTDEGDCTVPITSSTIYSNAIKTIVVEKGNFFQQGLASVNYHALFLTHSKVLNVVKRFFDNNTQLQEPDWFKSIGKESDVKLLS